jgi:hypothetical protein
MESAISGNRVEAGLVEKCQGGCGLARPLFSSAADLLPESSQKDFHPNQDASMLCAVASTRSEEGNGCLRAFSAR